MGFLVILANIVDHLHVLVVISLERVSTRKLQTEGVLKNEPDVLAALGEPDEEGGVEAVLLADFLGRGGGGVR